MKKTILILSAIAVLIVGIIVQSLFEQKYGAKDERRWFARSVGYEFSARVDSVKRFNEHAGRLRCLLTAGNPQEYREDSLKKLFKVHDILYLIFKRSDDSVTFVLPRHAELVLKGDSLHVSSSANTIQFFRTGKPLFTDSLSETLTGFSRPFFMKTK